MILYKTTITQVFNKIQPDIFSSLKLCMEHITTSLIRQKSTNRPDEKIIYN